MGATNYESEIDRYINKQLKRETLLGPFCENPFKYDSHYAPLNTRPKRESQKRRILVDVSCPKGDCVNEDIEKDKYLEELVKLTYTKVDDLVRIIQKIGAGCKLFKKDLR